MSQLNTTVVSCNVDASAEPLLAGKIQPFVVRTLPVSGAKVAIIGLTTDETVASSSPGARGVPWALKGAGGSCAQWAVAFFDVSFTSSLFSGEAATTA